MPEQQGGACQVRCRDDNAGLVDSRPPVSVWQNAAAQPRCQQGRPLAAGEGAQAVPGPASALRAAGSAALSGSRMRSATLLANAAVSSTMTRRGLTCTSRIGTARPRPGSLDDSAHAHATSTPVLPRPVGTATTAGGLPSANRSARSRCHGNGRCLCSRREVAETAHRAAHEGSHGAIRPRPKWRNGPSSMGPLTSVSKRTSACRCPSRQDDPTSTVLYEPGPHKPESGRRACCGKTPAGPVGLHLHAPNA